MDEIEILKAMLRSRSFENKLSHMFKKGAFYGTTHLNIGQEASHVGLIAGLDDKDWIVPTHRCHGFNIARGTKPEKMFAEMFGSRYGVCRGLGGSMHMTEISTCNAGSSAIVGSGVPIATGLAFALKRKGRENIAVAIFGDGATSRGSVHEAMNMASVWNIPVLFYLENNHYGMSASEKNAISTDNLSLRADGYSIKHIKIDGNDVALVRDTVAKARKYILENSRPFFIEVDTYRLCGHSKSDRLVYRTREEEEMWRKKDPICRFSSSLIEKGVISEDDYHRMEKEIDEEIEDAYIKAEAEKDDALTLRELDSFLFAPSPISRNTKGEVHKASYRRAIYEALDEILREDASAFLMGEDIGLYGGCFGVTSDLYEKHPGKVLETPVSEEGFTSIAVGASMLGLHPIVEIMYADFSTLASDPLINHAAKTYFMSAGQLNCPLVYRAPIGSGTGHGSQHTANIESMFLNTPGLIVVAPSDPYSAKALLKSAHRDNNPVLFFEHKGLYDTQGDVGDENTYLPLGKAIVSEYGSELLLIGYSHAFHTAFESTEDIRERLTYIDLATISPLDKDTIIGYASSFDKILIVQDTPECGSVGDSVISLIARNCNGRKDIRLVAARSLPIPFSRNLEKNVIPTTEEIRKAVFELLNA
ncbi:MAG TPA: pyruvate dehydrogenase [Candidatus Ornithospirochaeta stercorigallinarum]|nr:pyruvate dehydrogenase [Candidatus Ornithospirochaeta stercorigallinarum]